MRLYVEEPRLVTLCVTRPPCSQSHLKIQILVSNNRDENQRLLWYKEMCPHLSYRSNTCLYIIASYQ